VFAREAQKCIESTNAGEPAVLYLKSGHGIRKLKNNLNECKNISQVISAAGWCLNTSAHTELLLVPCDH
jgi:hypothetical protein